MVVKQTFIETSRSMKNSVEMPSNGKVFSIITCYYTLDTTPTIFKLEPEINSCVTSFSNYLVVCYDKSQFHCRATM